MCPLLRRLLAVHLIFKHNLPLPRTLARTLLLDCPLWLQLRVLRSILKMTWTKHCRQLCAPCWGQLLLCVRRVLWHSLPFFGSCSSPVKGHPERASECGVSAPELVPGYGSHYAVCCGNGGNSAPGTGCWLAFHYAHSAARRFSFDISISISRSWPLLLLRLF